MISYDKLKQSVEALGFTFFDKGEYNVNLIFERTSDEFTNYMTDWMHLAFNKSVISIRCSTKPGLIGSILKPITVNGITGTAVIVSPQQIKGGFLFIDENSEAAKNDVFFNNKWNKCSYFKENKCFDYWRDGDKDKTLDRVQLQENQFFGTHAHKGGEPINNWSLGCIVYPEKDFRDKVQPVIREAVKRYGNVFTVTIIESKNIL